MKMASTQPSPTSPSTVTDKDDEIQEVILENEENQSNIMDIVENEENNSQNYDGITEKEKIEELITEVEDNGIRYLRCIVCGKQTRRKYNLTKHVRNEHMKNCSLSVLSKIVNL